MDWYGLFNDNQIRFARGRTIDDQILFTHGMISKWCDVDFFVDVVLFEFSNVVDVVSHHLLSDELGLLGICSLLIEPFDLLFDVHLFFANNKCYSLK